MVLRLGPQPEIKTGINAELARDVSTRLLAGQKEELIRFQLSKNWSVEEVSKHIELARQNPFFQGALSLSQSVGRRDWIIETTRRSHLLLGDVAEVPRLSGMTPDQFLREHYVAHKPAILTDWIDNWPALKLWNPDYLDRKIGRTTQIELQKGRSKTANFEIEKLKLKTRIPFGELTDFIRKDEPSNDMYVTANNGATNRAALDPIWSDFSAIPGITKSDAGNDGFLWIGPKGTLTPFHHDLTHNLLIQVTGRKRVHIVPSWEEARMKPLNKYFSEWSLEKLKAAPAASRPTLLECEIGPGDALFIPVGWWHHVEGLEASCSVLFTNFVWPNDYTTPFMVG